MRLFFEEKLFFKIYKFFQKNVLRFLSLRYGADFRRSRLVLFSPYTRLWLAFLILFLWFLVSVKVAIWLSVCPDTVPVYVVFFSASFVILLFSNRYGNFLQTFSFSDRSFSTNCFLPMRILIFFIQSFPSSGVMSVRSDISISIFCCFHIGPSSIIVPRNFTSFLFTTWYRFPIF